MEVPQKFHVCSWHDGVSQLFFLTFHWWRRRRAGTPLWLPVPTVWSPWTRTYIIVQDRDVMYDPEKSDARKGTIFSSKDPSSIHSFWSKFRTQSIAMHPIAWPPPVDKAYMTRRRYRLNALFHPCSPRKCSSRLLVLSDPPAAPTEQTGKLFPWELDGLKKCISIFYSEGI